MRSHATPSDNSSLSRTATSCPVCRASQLKAYPPGRDRLFCLVPGIFTMFRCKSCGCIFQHPLPDSSILAKSYPKEYWWSEDAPKATRWVRLFRKLEKAYREFVTKDHVRFLDRSARNSPKGQKRLLDIGCGNGTFLHVAESRGFKPHGMDASARAAEIASTQYGITVRQGEIGSRVWDGERFDFVTMFHVLEHLPNPRLALEHARVLLQPSGRLIIQVPNISSVQARIFGRFWYGLDVPRHVINFTPEALKRLLTEMGFGFRLSTRFSLRDNPASFASSLAPWLDPVRRKGRSRSNPLTNGILEIIYFGLFLIAMPVAFAESLFGSGGTIWVCAWDARSPGAPLR